MSHGELILYVAADGGSHVQLRAEDGTVWLTQTEIAELFQTTPQSITQHLKAIYAEGELQPEATCKEDLQVRSESGRRVRRKLNSYSLEMILAIGYRVRSPRGVQFRQWATTHLREYLLKGFVMDDARLRQAQAADYFDELLARIRDIRSSEKVFWRKVLDTGEHLLELLQTKTPVVTTLIHKFRAGLNKRKWRDDDRDLFVLIDESHRSQYGDVESLHARMREVLPNACVVGFTGTPLARRERNTFLKFGPLVAPAYTLTDAVAEGAVVPLLYEGRLVEQDIDAKAVDAWFERSTRELSAAQKRDLKKRMSRPAVLLGVSDWLRCVAFDIGQHYRQNFHGSGLKGQVVVPSKRDAILMKRIFDEIGDVKCEVVISGPDMREDETAIDESSDNEVKDFWKKMMQRYGDETAYNRQIIEAFKGPEGPELLIVVSKLLTGFDAPRNTVLYLARPLKEHTLLQAIARVNRVFDEEGGADKPFGYIIDYCGVLRDLNALEVAQASREFVESLPADRLGRWRADARRFEGLRAHVQARYAEKVDWADYRKRVQRLLDQHVTSHEVSTIIEPLPVFDDKALQAAREQQNRSDASVADEIASQMKRRIDEKWEEDPVYYENFSRLIQNVIDAFRQHRFDEKSYLEQVHKLRDGVDRRDADASIPAVIRDDGHAVAFWGITQRALVSSGLSDVDELAAKLAACIAQSVQRHRIVGWQAGDTAVENRVRADIDAFYFDELGAPSDFPPPSCWTRSSTRHWPPRACACRTVTMTVELLARWGLETISFTLRRAPVARLAIEVSPSGRVDVIAPEHADEAEVLARVSRRGAWIVRQRDDFERMRPRTPVRQYVSGETHLLHGRQLRLKVLRSELGHVSVIGDRLQVATPDWSDRTSIKTLMDDWYASEARTYLHQRFALQSKLWARHGVIASGLIVRTLSARWGSMTSKGRLVLNQDLVRASPALVDYVIAHEMAHVLHPNHGSEWRRLLGSVMPDWGLRKNQLERQLV